MKGRRKKIVKSQLPDEAETDRIPDHEGIDLESLSSTRPGSKGLGECGCTGPLGSEEVCTRCQALLLLS